LRRLDFNKAEHIELCRALVRADGERIRHMNRLR